MTELRQYQHNVIDAFEREIAAGYKRVILVAPTGSGKTVIGSEIIRRARAQDRHILVLAHRREIITQTHQKLAANGVRAGIIQAGFDARPLEWVQVASISTLHHRAIRRDVMELPLADLLVIDEAHHAPARTYRKIIQAYPDAVLLGLTATPCRGDDRGLGGIFEKMIECPQIAELIDQGHLVKADVYAPVDPDLTGVATRKGDYVEAQLADRMDRPKLVGDIVTHWHKFGDRRKTVAFAVNVAHSIHLRDEFRRSGVRAEHIDGSTSKDERDATLARLATGDIDLITNCMVLTEGWDCPETSCCILARPTKKMGLFRQMVGRVLRPAPGKARAVVLDHSGVVFRHGLPEDRVVWTLDADDRATSPDHTARSRNISVGLIECTQCSALRVGGQPCMHCGFLPQRPAQYVPISEGELSLVKNGRAHASAYDQYERDRWLGMLTTIGRERGYKPGWAAANFKQKFGAWPPYGVAVMPLTPSAEVRAWVRSRAIAYAKAMGKASR